MERKTAAIISPRASSAEKGCRKVTLSWIEEEAAIPEGVLLGVGGVERKREGEGGVGWDGVGWGG